MNIKISYKVYKSLNEKSDETYAKIAKLRWSTPDEKMDFAIDWMKKNNFGVNLKTEWFEVVAYDSADGIEGFAFFMQNPYETEKWYLGDLVVDESYRRQSVATNIIRTGLEMISDYGAKSIYAYIERENIGSIKLHEKLGFRNLETLVPLGEFNFGDDQTTFEYKL